VERSLIRYNDTLSREQFRLSSLSRLWGHWRKFMKVPFVICSALILSLSGALAAENGAPLRAGKPAGVRQAQLLDDGNGMLVVAGAALVGITIALATTSNNVAQPTGTAPGGGGSTSTTSTTGTSS
jgi:hypothetical protein